LKHSPTGLSLQSPHFVLFRFARPFIRDVVRLLLQYDATPNLPDSRGSSALHLAAWAGHQDICKLLLTHSHRPANPNLQTVDNCTPLHCAAQHGHTGALTTLLAHGADPSVQNIRCETPLDLAAQYGRLQVVQMLIRAHPELLLPLKYETTVSHSPLHLASRNGHKNVVEVLLMAGVHVNLLTARGTALHEAALTGKESVVRLLLSAGADLDLTDCEGRTVLDLLEQFPPHVTRGIVTVIHNCRNSMLAYGSATESDDMKENHGPPPRGHRQNHHYGNRKYRRSISPYTYDTSGEREDSSPMHHPWNSYQ
jgi:ankyrin repeat and SAM domain-containing protein 1